MISSTQTAEKHDDGVAVMLGELLLVVVALLAFSVIATLVLSLQSSFNPAIDANARVAADPVSDLLTVTHVGGDPVRTDDLKLVVSINSGPVINPAFTLVDSTGAPDASGVWSVGKRLVVSLPMDVGQRLEVLITDQRHDRVVSSGVFTIMAHPTASSTQNPVTLPTSPPPYPTYTSVTGTTTTITTTTVTTTQTQPPTCYYCAYFFGWVNCANASQVLTVQATGCTAQNWILKTGGIIGLDTAYGDVLNETFSFYLDGRLIDTRIEQLVDCRNQSPPLRLMILNGC